MRNETRVLFRKYTNGIACANGVENAAEKFTVTPTAQQKLEEKMQESAAFLQKINVVPVDEKNGTKVGLDVSHPIASTTNTDSGSLRVPTDPLDLTSSEFNAEKINFDFKIPYARLDAWAKFKDFEQRIRNYFLTRMALDRIMIGFNGTSRAATSNLSTNPLLQDVSIGWLKRHKTDAPSRVLSQVGSTGKIQIGDSVASSAGYKNLDALVYDLVSELIDPWYREDQSLVCILGRKLQADTYFPLINKTQPNSEKIAADVIISAKRIGGLPAVSVPYFPENGIAITSLQNLSSYYQLGTMRRAVIDNPAGDCINFFNSGNYAYVIEDNGMMCQAENIELVS